MTATDETLAGAFGMPGFLAPWADRFFEPQELRLVEALEAGPLTVAELLAGVFDFALDDLRRAHRRGIVDLEGDAQTDPPGAVDVATMIALADFHARFDIWAMFEGWKDIPEDVAERLCDWELEHYTTRIAADVTAFRDGRRPAGEGADLTYLLLEEAEAAVRAAPRVYVRPCDCRAMFRRCRKPLDVCLGFGHDRGLGWEISRERAVEILRRADRAGLMHTGFASPAPGEAGGVCNCCADCCFPHLAAERLDAAAVWPRRRYRTSVAAAACTLCGRCVKRCPFAALSLGEALELDAELCRGCGLCAAGCPEGALTMEPLGAAPAANE
jgi:ferredoxin